MTSVLQKLRDSRKSPSVLKLAILKVHGAKPDVLIFVFEGVEDIPVYEDWLSRILNCPEYEPIAGNGKRQLISLFQQLRSANDSLLQHVYFFVDRDFDEAIEEHSHLFELPAYSIECLICVDAVLESILIDEFRLAGHVIEREKIKALYIQDRGRFTLHAEAVNFALFAARRSNAKLVKKPDRAVQICEVKISDVSPIFVDASEIVLTDPPMSKADIEVFRKDFESLPPILKQRGKYELDLMRRWVALLYQDASSAAPSYFPKIDTVLGGDPSTASLRRYAAAAPVPEKLRQFVDTIAIGQT